MYVFHKSESNILGSVFRVTIGRLLGYVYSKNVETKPYTAGPMPFVKSSDLRCWCGYCGYYLSVIHFNPYNIVYELCNLITGDSLSHNLQKRYKTHVAPNNVILYSPSSSNALLYR